jgi:hypothetical protein
MRHDEFQIGMEFRAGEGIWRVTDLGARTVIAIRLDRVEVGNNDPDSRHTLDRADAERDGWFNGPPYAVAEAVFDEYDIEDCEPVE